MPDYTRDILIDATASHVFGFVSKVGNLPKYLPTVHEAKSQDSDRVAVSGTANGHDYNSDGYFKVDKDNRTLSWGSDGENDYSGRMEVHAVGDEGSKVICTLHFNPHPATAESMATHQGGRDKAITDGLEASLLSIKNEAEGVGGKVESSADH